MAEQLLTLTFVLLLFTVVTNLVRLWRPHAWGDLASQGWLVLSAASMLGILVIRIIESNRMPFANMYEFSILFALAILLVFLFLRYSLKSPLFDLSVAVLLTILLAIASTLPAELKPLMPALQSRWLHAHVATAIIAYAAFAMAFCLGIMYLMKAHFAKTRQIRQLSTDLKKIDRMIYKLVVLGFSLLTIVIITGAVWAEEVWGNWWSWDPKETWSLVTWVVYASYLHARRTKEWRGRKSAWLAVIGFLVVLFTLFGVSILLPGLHSYA